MKLAPHKLTTALLLVFTVLSGTASADFVGKVIAVSDGYSIKVLRDGTNAVKVRLVGIDAPERRQAFGTRARQYTAKLAFGKMVTVKENGTDR